MEAKRCLGCMKVKSQVICEHCGYDERTENALHQLPVGTVLKEQYQIGRVLGQGGFGITYLGWDLYLSMPVAIKEYYPSGTVMREHSTSLSVYNCTDDNGARFQNNKERFLREAKMLARFSQVPQVVQVKNFFLANNTAYIVMEYVDGINLKRYVRAQGGKLSPAETFRILRPIMDALCRVHKSELVHRDISPDNIMMLPDGTAKLLDFGAVRDLSKEASTQIVLKHGYAPLEQYQQHGNLGPWTDVYALCATIYFCLTGEVPPDAPERLLGDENLGWKDRVPELTDHQRKALEHGMELRSENRTTSMDMLCKELFHDEAEESVVEITDEKTLTKEEKKEEKKAGTPPIKSLAFAGLFALIILVMLFLIPRDQEVPGEETQTTGVSILSGSCGESLNWEFDPECGLLKIRGTGAMQDYDENENVSPWRNAEVSSVVFEEGITSIGAYAFYNCSLTELILPESLETIGAHAFSGNSMSDVMIPNGVTYLDKGCFDNCGSLKTVTIGPDTRLNYDIWYGPMFGNGETDITICGYSNTMVEDYARIWNYYFESTGTNEWDLVGTEPGGNNAAKWYFDADTGFLLINGGITVNSYISTDPADPKTYVTYNQVPGWMEIREQIVTVSFDTIYGIGSYTFAHCTNLTDVYFGEELGHIGYGAFKDTNLDEVNFSTLTHDGAGVIHPYAFAECENLREVVLDETLDEIKEYAFSGCPNLEKFYAEKYFAGLPNDGLKTIFTSEENPQYPEKMTIYGLKGGWEQTFADSHDIPFAAGIWGLLAEDQGQCGENAWWFKSGDTLVVSCFKSGVWNYMPDTEGRVVHDLAPTDEPEYKKYASEIRELIIYTGNFVIGSGSFMGMDALESIMIKTDGNVDIRDHAFADCDSLTSVTIPAQVIVVDEYAFADCDNLAKVYMRGGNSIGQGVFANCPKLEGIWFFGKKHNLYGDILSPNGEQYNKNIIFHALYDHTNVISYTKKHNLTFSGDGLYG